MPGLSDELATHVATLPASALSARTIHAAKRALLDGVGVLIAASGSSVEIAPFVDYAIGSGPGPASLLGRDERVGAAAAALANGAMAHALDFEDAFDAAPCHPNAALLPAALATLQDGNAATGLEFLTAIAIGCDLVCRLGLSLRRTMEEGGWYPPPILGGFGAVAAAARLRRLTPRQVTDAFSMMLCQLSVPGEIKHSRDTVIRAIREAFPAQAAVQCAVLAASGVRGFDAPFEGKSGFFQLFVDGEYDPAVLREQLGQRFWIDELSFKRWPACRGTHAYIEAAQTMRARHTIDPTRISEIVVTGGTVQTMLVEPAERKRRPTVTIDAKFSIPFTVAAAFIDEEVTLDSFEAASLTDPRTLALAERVRYVARPDWGHENAASGVLAIRLDDGSRFEEHVEVAIGHPSRPLSDGALRAKFIDCVARGYRPIPADAAGRLADMIMTLEAMPDASRILA